jgi:hypothetical protein
MSRKCKEMEFLFSCYSFKMKAATRRSWGWGAGPVRACAATPFVAARSGSASRLILGSSPAGVRHWAAKAGSKQAAEAQGGQASALSYFVARTSSHGCGIVGACPFLPGASSRGRN